VGFFVLLIPILICVANENKIIILGWDFISENKKILLTNREISERDFIIFSL